MLTPCSKCQDAHCTPLQTQTELFLVAVLPVLFSKFPNMINCTSDSMVYECKQMHKSFVSSSFSSPFFNISFMIRLVGQINCINMFLITKFTNFFRRCHISMFIVTKLCSLNKRTLFIMILAPQKCHVND